MRRRWIATGAVLLAVMFACARSVPGPSPVTAPDDSPKVMPREPVEAIESPKEEVEPSPAPPPAPEPLSAPLHIRVGLATDQTEVTFPCCEGELVAEARGQTVAVASPLHIRPAAGTTRKGVFRLQVAALKDERQADQLRRRVGERTGEPSDSLFDAGTDLYRVRVGRYASREEAEEARRRLARLGIEGTWIVSEGGGISDPALLLSQGERTIRVPGRWLVLRSQEDGGLQFNGKHYRGRILIYLTDRGSLNLINEIGLEDYLRGVVPREMGPNLYDQLEALKAQAVAARTYTLRNLGEFSEEGYDICATPRCQVYGGREVEHPLTDQAIAETAGQVLLYRGEPVDALYSSTCGGHTEDVEVVFPLKSEPYLQGVPCLEAGFDLLHGHVPRSTPLATALMRRLLPSAATGDPVADLSARLEHLALLAGLPVPLDRLASLDRKEVRRFVGSIFDLALDVRLFVAAEDLPYLLETPPPDWSEDDLRLAGYFSKMGLENGALNGELAPLEVEELLLSLAEYLQVIKKESAQYLSLGDDGLRFRLGAEEKVHSLPSWLAAYRSHGGEPLAGDLKLLAGDRLALYWKGEEMLAVVQEVDRDGVAYDRSSHRASWTRFRSDRELADSVHTRYPGFEFQGFEIIERGESGRVGRIRLVGADGDSIEVQGLAVRWTLQVPDTLFTVKRLTPEAGRSGWLFSGRGWGHGVGMCQVGAYGMAVRGRSYREILHHYYTGVQLGRVRLPNRADE